MRSVLLKYFTWTPIALASVFCGIAACSSDDVAPTAETTGQASAAVSATTCTAAGQCTLVLPVPYGAEQAVLSATTSLVLGDSSTVSASAGVPGAVANLGPVLTVVGQNVSVGVLDSEASVALGAGTVVNGPLTTGGLLLNPSGAVVKGKVTMLSPVDADEHVTTTVTFPATVAAPVIVPAGTTQRLTPGTYGDVLVSPGATLSLSAGTYKLDSLTVLPGATLDLDETSGTVVVYALETFEFAGAETQHGGDGRVLVAAFGCGLDILAAPFRGTVSAQNASLSLVTATGATFAGRYFASAIQLGVHDSVLGLPTAMPGGPPSSTPPSAPTPLPAPPPPVVGCYVNSLNGWKSIPCATEAFVSAHFPHPDAQLTVSSASPAPSLVYGQLEVTVPEVGSESNAFLASTAGIPGCTSSGTAVANQWSVQNNTNQWTVPSTAASGAGDTAATQFTLQSDGSTTGICIWEVDVSAVPQVYTNKCATPPAEQRAGGLQAFDSGNLAATINSNGTVSLVADISWVPSGQPTQYAVVSPDTYSLAGNWSEVSGGLIGYGACSQAQLTTAEMITTVLASTCAGDTDATSPTCSGAALQPNASAFFGGTGTVETNNLTTLGTPSVSYLNSDLVVSSMTATTSGSCLGPSHVYVKDNATDFGATPSNVGGQVFWESPDVFLVPHGSPVDVTATSSETLITPGGQFDIYVRVHNDLGCSQATGVKALVYLADPSALSAEWDSVTGGAYVGDSSGSTGITVAAGAQGLIGPITFTAPTTGIGDGHRCILAAIEADGEAAPGNDYDAPDSNQVAQRNLQFVGPCEYPLTNATSSNGNLALTLNVTPTGTTLPSLTTLPEVEVTFDDADSSWFNVWSTQTGAGTTFAVTHSSSANTTTVRLGAYSVALASVPLAAGQSRAATGLIDLPTGAPGATLQIQAVLSDSSGHTLVTNGGSCQAVAPPVIR